MFQKILSKVTATIVIILYLTTPVQAQDSLITQAISGPPTVYETNQLMMLQLCYRTGISCYYFFKPEIQDQILKTKTLDELGGLKIFENKTMFNEARIRNPLLLEAIQASLKGACMAAVDIRRFGYMRREQIMQSGQMIKLIFKQRVEVTINSEGKKIAKLVPQEPHSVPCYVWDVRGGGTRVNDPFFTVDISPDSYVLLFNLHWDNQGYFHAMDMNGPISPIPSVIVTYDPNQ